MKLKEVCEVTGLSRKTIRLYEEKGLLVPQKESRGGREYREYTAEDVKTLQVVASLRKAWFTMEEIRRMQQDPAAIREIFPQYRAWLLAQKSQLDGLLAAAEQIELDSIADVEQLSAQIEQETRKLPLPLVDANPHFKHLDEIEETPRVFKPVDHLDKVLPGDKIYRQMAVTTSRAPWDDLIMKTGQLNETMEAVRKEKDGPVQDREPERDPALLRPILVLLTLAAVVSVCIGLIFAVDGVFLWQSWGVFALCAGLRGLYGYLKYRKAQRAWIDRMNQDK